MRIEIRRHGQSKSSVLKAEMVEANTMAVQWSGKEIQKRAKLLCPTNKDPDADNPGTLKNSITERTEVEGDAATSYTGTNVDYGPYVELGTGQRGYMSAGDKAPDIAEYRADWQGMPAQPYLYPAIKSLQNTIRAKFTERLRRAIKKLQGDAT